MANISLFDIDISLKQDPKTRDLKELYNEDVINQAIDIFISNPYRIGRGLVNTLFDRVYTDIVNENLSDIEGEILREFQENFNVINVNELLVEPINGNRGLRISLSWGLVGYELFGSYRRLWAT